MKTGFLAGLVVGLLLGVAVGYLTSHFWVWLLLGVAIATWFGASRMRRPKSLSPSTAHQ